MLESFDMMVTDFPYHEKSDIRYTINFITKLLYIDMLLITKTNSNIYYDFEISQSHSLLYYLICNLCLRMRIVNYSGVININLGY